MSDDNLTVSDVQHYVELGERWDKQSLADTWDQGAAVEVEVSVESSRTCYALESVLSRRLRILARQHGVSAETLLNLWVQEKIVQAEPAAPATTP